MLISTHKFALAFTSCLVVTGCGGGSSGSSDLVEDATGTTSGGTTISEDSVPTNLDQLLGRTIFSYRFEPSGTNTFFYTGQFSQSNITTNANGIANLNGSVAHTFLPDGSETISVGENFQINCAETNSSGEIYCNIFFQSGASENFLFPPLVDGKAFGNYEHCPDDVDAAPCLGDLFNNPDGNVMVTNEPSEASASLAYLRNSSNNIGSIDIVAYLEYEEQAAYSALYPMSQFETSSSSILQSRFEHFVNALRTQNGRQ